MGLIMTNGVENSALGTREGRWKIVGGNSLSSLVDFLLLFVSMEKFPVGKTDGQESGWKNELIQ